MILHDFIVAVSTPWRELGLEKERAVNFVKHDGEMGFDRLAGGSLRTSAIDIESTVNRNWDLREGEGNAHSMV